MRIPLRTPGRQRFFVTTARNAAFECVQGVLIWTGAKRYSVGSGT
jgi:hypothetical protein